MYVLLHIRIGLEFPPSLLKTLKQHKLAMHFSESACDCETCGKMFANDIQLQEHIENVHMNGKYKCDTCDKTFSRIKQLKEHGANVHGLKLNCELCGKSFNRADGLREHIAIVHEGITFKCEFCDKSYS